MYLISLVFRMFISDQYLIVLKITWKKMLPIWQCSCSVSDDDNPCDKCTDQSDHKCIGFNIIEGIEKGK